MDIIIGSPSPTFHRIFGQENIGDMGTMPPYISAQLAMQLTPSKAKTPIPTLATCMCAGYGGK